MLSVSGLTEGPRPEIGFRLFSSSLSLVCIDYKINFPSANLMVFYNRPAHPERDADNSI
jgi:hypothetical protein